MTENIAQKQVVNNSSPFITAEDVFNISIDYYREGVKVIVEGNDKYDDKKEKSSIGFMVRYPSQADVETIMQGCKDILVDVDENMDLRKFIKIELFRFLTLVKAWSVEQPISNENIMNLHPDIIKAVLAKVRSELGTNGII